MKIKQLRDMVHTIGDQVDETQGHRHTLHITSVRDFALLYLWEHIEGLLLSSWRHP